MIYGVHPVEEAIAAGREIDRIFILRSAQNEAVQKLSADARKMGIAVKAVPIEKLNRLTRKNHQGVVAFLSAVNFADMGHVIDQAFSDGEQPLVVILDHITDVRNVSPLHAQQSAVAYMVC